MKEFNDRQERRGAAAGPLAGQDRSPAPRLAGPEVHPPQAHQAGRQAAPSATRGCPRASMLQLYINDEFFDTPTPGKRLSHRVQRRSSASSTRTKTSCWWTSGPAWRSIPTTGRSTVNTLIDHIQAYLYQKREWRPRRGERLHPRPVQPHRPQHRRHRHRRQRRRRPCAS